SKLLNRPGAGKGKRQVTGLSPDAARLPVITAKRTIAGEVPVTRMDITVKKRTHPAECAVPLRLHKRHVYLTTARVHRWGDDMTGTLEARQDAGRRVQSAVKHL